MKTGGEFRNHAGEQGVLGGMDFLGKRFEGIIRGACDLGLAEVGTAIDFRSADSLTPPWEYPDWAATKPGAWART